MNLNAKFKIVKCLKNPFTPTLLHITFILIYNINNLKLMLVPWLFVAVIEIKNAYIFENTKRFGKLNLT